MAKSTCGTGCFMLLNTGEAPVQSRSGMLTTPAYQINGRTAYAIEASIFIGGAAVKRLRDGLGLIQNPADTAALAAGCTGIDLRADPRLHARARRARGTRVRRFSDARPVVRDGGRRHAAHCCIHLDERRCAVL